MAWYLVSYISEHLVTVNIASFWFEVRRANRDIGKLLLPSTELQLIRVVFLFIFYFYEERFLWMQSCVLYCIEWFYNRNANSKLGIKPTRHWK